MIVTMKPDPALQESVEMLWAIPSQTRKAAQHPETSCHELFPDSTVNLVFRFSNAGCRMVLVGPNTEKSSVEVAPGSEYFGFKFHTAQVPRLVDATPHELINNACDLTHLQGERIELLAERLLEQPCAESRRALMEGLLRKAQTPLLRDERCRRAAALLEKQQGRLQVRDLAFHMGLSPRSLERMFRAHLGMVPKHVARLVRFKHLVKGLRSGGFPNLAELALHCGYTDQSHMAREFKEMTGLTPGRYIPAENSRVNGAPKTHLVHRYQP